MNRVLNRRKVGLVVTSLLVLSVSGCSYGRQLATLKRLGDNQKEIERYVAAQEKGFYKLSDDLKNERLQIGLSKKEIISLYGHPVLSRRLEDNPLFKEELLYRLPTEYFRTSRIYLYFDIEDKLVKWKYDPSL
ncbi:MAG: hypothetical protein JSW17_02400 [Candidatus Omnitrophota bacterium]|nr:MAG: hypothetical protein JSW17_02400 [Candidatus Omnitrophota bacterium]